jgi:hypothetical protein
MRVWIGFFWLRIVSNGETWDLFKHSCATVSFSRHLLSQMMPFIGYRPYDIFSSLLVSWHPWNSLWLLAAVAAEDIRKRPRRGQDIWCSIDVPLNWYLTRNWAPHGVLLLLYLIHFELLRGSVGHSSLARFQQLQRAVGSSDEDTYWQLS